LEKLRVATLNIWNKSGPWAERLSLMRKQVKDIYLVPVGERVCQGVKKFKALVST